MLRRECPWDRAQTATSIVPHTVEEAYEVADAVREAGLSPKLIDELGDLLFQTTFLALLCEEAEVGAWVDVALGVAAKLRMRHPWVFGAESAETAGDARNRWEDVKVESEGREGIFHDVPGSLPGLLEARKLQRRAAAIGFDYATAAARLRRSRERAARAARRARARPEPEAEREPRPEVAARSATCSSRASTSRAATTAIPSSRCAPPAPASASASSSPSASPTPRASAFRAVGTAQQEHYYQAAKQFSQGSASSDTIASVHARQILDSRGNPTVEVDVVTDDGAIGRAAVPSGASTGSHEAVERRDGGSAYGGKAVAGAVASVNGELAPALIGHDVHDQRGVDRLLLRARRHAEQGPPRRERRPRRLARGRARPRADGARAAALALARRARRRTCCRCR